MDEGSATAWQRNLKLKALSTLLRLKLAMDRY